MDLKSLIVPSTPTSLRKEMSLPCRRRMRRSVPSRSHLADLSDLTRSQSAGRLTAARLAGVLDQMMSADAAFRRRPGRQRSEHRCWRSFRLHDAPWSDYLTPDRPFDVELPSSHQANFPLHTNTRSIQLTSCHFSVEKMAQLHIVYAD